MAVQFYNEAGKEPGLQVTDLRGRVIGGASFKFLRMIQHARVKDKVLKQMVEFLKSGVEQ